MPLGSVSVVSSPADDASHRQAAEQLLVATNTEQVLDDSLEASLQMQISQNPMLAPYADTMRAFFEKHLAWESIKPELVDLYVTSFTEKELKEISKFYSTPVGRKAITKLPELMSAGAAIGQRRVQENMGELVQMIQQKEKELQGAEGQPGG
jgi:hypothetical protein